MTTFAALYVNPWAKQGEETDRASMQAQLIACRAHAVACGYSVQGVFANLAGGRDGQRGASGDLLELVQNWPPSSNGSEEVGGLVVVVYDGRHLLNEDGRPDPVARLIAAYGVRVESALPPHSVPEVNTYFEPAAVQIASQTMRDLLGVRDSAPLVRAPAETIDYPSGTAGDGTLDEETWRAVTDLLQDEQRLRQQICARRAASGLDSERRALWLEALEGTQHAEAEVEKRRIKLLDLLLDEVIDKHVLACRREQIDVQLHALRRERQRAHAELVACSLSPASEELIVEIAHHLIPVLEGLDASKRRSAAKYLQVKGEPQDDGRVQVTCMLPLVDDSQREHAEWTVRKTRGRAEQLLTVPPLQGPGAPAEDYPLAWTIWPGAGTTVVPNPSTVEVRV